MWRCRARHVPEPRSHVRVHGARPDLPTPGATAASRRRQDPYSSRPEGRSRSTLQRRPVWPSCRRQRSERRLPATEQAPPTFQHPRGRIARCRDRCPPSLRLPHEECMRPCAKTMLAALLRSARIRSSGRRQQRGARYRSGGFPAAGSVPRRVARTKDRRHQVDKAAHSVP